MFAGVVAARLHGPSDLVAHAMGKVFPRATAGEADVLIVQPLQDRLCPIKIGRDLALRLGARARYVEVPHCGHAILPEQPEAIARCRPGGD